MARRRKKKKKGQKPPTGPEKTREAAPPAAREPAPVPLDEEAITSRGKKTIGAGIGILVAGFFILTLTDPQGRNWASSLSPLLILGGYAVVALGIFLPEPEKTEKAAAEEGGSPEPGLTGPDEGGGGDSSPSQTA